MTISKMQDKRESIPLAATTSKTQPKKSQKQSIVPSSRSLRSRNESNPVEAKQVPAKGLHAKPVLTTLPSKSPKSNATKPKEKNPSKKKSSPLVGDAKSPETKSNLKNKVKSATQPSDSPKTRMSPSKAAKVPSPKSRASRNHPKPLSLKPSTENAKVSKKATKKAASPKKTTKVAKGEENDALEVIGFKIEIPSEDASGKRKKDKSANKTPSKSEKVANVATKGNAKTMPKAKQEVAKEGPKRSARLAGK
jgi:hypothetical protein